MYKYSVKKKKTKKKKHQRKVIQKLRKGVKSFLCFTHCLNHIHISIKFHQDILYSYLFIYGMHKVSLKFHKKEVTQKMRKGDQSFLYTTHHLNLIHIAIKFHQDIP